MKATSETRKRLIPDQGSLIGDYKICFIIFCVLFRRSLRAQAYAASVVCSRKFENETEQLANGNILEGLEKISHSSSQIFHQIRWRLRPILPNESIVSFITKDCRCFTFNSLNAHEMFTEE